jgi:hypothetical protein
MTVLSNTKHRLEGYTTSFLRMLSLDPSGKNIVKANMFIAGGAINSLTCNEEPNDIDLYFIDSNAAAFVIEYIVRAIKSIFLFRDGVFQSLAVSANATDYVKNTKTITLSFSLAGRPIDLKTLNEMIANSSSMKSTGVHFSSNAISFSLHKVKYQVITRFIGEPEDVVECFDFAHCKNFFLPHRNVLSISNKAMMAQATRQLVYEGSMFPLTSMVRVKKFVRRGWSINAGELLKIGMQMNDFDWTNKEVLKDQLLGVDTRQFEELIDRLDKKHPDDQPIPRESLLEEVSKIFL